MKRKTRRLIFFFIIIGFLAVACAVVGSLVLGRSSGAGSLQLAAPKDLQGFVLSIYLNTRSGDLTSPAGKDDSPVLFTIERGESLNTIANRLQSEKLITDPDLFKRYLQYNGLDASIEAGDFELKQTMSIQQIAKTLQEGRIAELNVRIPQGKRLEEIADIVATQVPISSTDFLELAKDASQWKSQFEFLNDLPEGASLEGYIFPDTYSLPRDKVTARDVIITALRNFDKQVTPQMRTDLQAQGRTLYDAIRLASIVEREAGVEKERPTIAGVYMNRLNDGIALDADPTIQYGLGDTRDPNTWWPQITQDDYQGVQSPYNTYLYPGLPPSPIANPALASIQAAIYPEKHPYYFFRTSCNNDGTHVFAKTLEEQIAHACP
ncbi:MAG TPA: endolytic transglycosylase MltG [Anaerolineae bacterium]|nr:endolytic transglycosylase MltG [Anaerolineae bacterium]